MASALAGIMAVPAGMYFATITEAPLAIIGAAVVFLPLYVFILLRGHPDPKEEKTDRSSTPSS